MKRNKPMLLLNLLSKLPLSTLYFISGIISFILFHIVRYRRTISLNNISNSFPDKSNPQIKIIQRSAYRYLTDSFFETIKARKLTDDDLRSRVTLENFEELQSFIQNGQSVFFLSAHTAPTEWVLFALHLKLGCIIDPVYKPVHNKSIDRFIFTVRSRYQSTPIPYKDLAKDIVLRKSANRCIAMLADLEPRSRDQSIEVDFLNRPTRFFLSSERIAKLTNLPVFFIAIKQTSKGYYKATAELLSKTPNKLDSDSLTKKYAHCVEQVILQNPEAWLWTHRRWKHPSNSS